MKKNRITEYIYEQSFIDWVLNPNAKNDTFWSDYIKNNPSERDAIFRAKKLILKLQAQNLAPSSEIKESIWMNINKHVDRYPFKKKKIDWRLVAAAVALLVLIVSGILYKFITSEQNIVDYKSIAKIETSKNQVKLVLADNTEKFLNSTSPKIEYDEKGAVIVDSLITIRQVNQNPDSNTSGLNQLVVPKGKRSTLTLGDGTTVHLNSGSRVIYPVHFKKEYREIYIEGEAFLIVSHNEKSPFYVVANELKVRVLGTEFNVRSYPDDNNSSVVLVNGSVQTIIRSEKFLLKENELLLLDRKSGEVNRKEIDVLEYIGWKDGWLYCNEEGIESVTRKLSRYYDVNIEFASEAAKRATIIGKLDLKSECRNVMDVVAYTASVHVEEKNGSFIISEK